MALSEGQRHQAMLRARDLGLVEMNCDGRWELTRDGRDFLDMFDVLRSLDSRAGADRPSSPLAAGSERPATPHGNAPGGQHAGDDRRHAAGRRTRK